MSGRTADAGTRKLSNETQHVILGRKRSSKQQKSAQWRQQTGKRCLRTVATATPTEATESSSSSFAARLPGAQAVIATGLEESLQERRQSGLLAGSSPPPQPEGTINKKFQELVSSGNANLTVNEIAGAFNFPLDRFQMEAAQEFLTGHSVMVCAPTGAGKTAIAEAATIAVLARGGRVIYTTPLKALSNQKLHEMRVQFGEERVGLQTGDARLNAEGDIVIMTTEVLRNIIFRTATDSGESAAEMRNVGLVVLDEVHYLGDATRGSVWEEVIISCPSEIPLLCMSATVRNPEDLGGWITKVHGSCKTIVTDFRPVPLLYNFCFRAEQKTEILPLLANGVQLNPALGGESADQEEESRGFGNPRHRRRRKPQQGPQEEPPSIRETLLALRGKRLLPSIWFVFSRKGCDLAVLALHKEGVRLTNAAESSIITKAIGNLRREQPEAIRDEMLLPLEDGIASHHAGCMPAWKTLIELLYQQGVIKVVFATGTLAAGINMPARSTVISSLSRRLGEGHVTHSHNELSQMAGRAGRRGFDSEGHCVLLQDRYSHAQSAVDVLKRGPEPLRSQFSTGYGMVLRLLHRRTLQSAREFVERSFFNYLAREGVKAREQAIAAAEEQAKVLLEQAAEAETAAGGAEGKFKTYLQLKRKYQDCKRDRRKAVRAAARSRGEAAERILGKTKLPALVGLEIETLDYDDEKQTVPALLLASNWFAAGETGADQPGFLCLTTDNRLFRAHPKHIAAVREGEFVFEVPDLSPVLAVAEGVKLWKSAKSGALFAEGSASTAISAARIPNKNLKEVEPAQVEATAMAKAVQALVKAKQEAQAAQSAANKAKTYREDLRIRAEATKLRRKAKDWRLALEVDSRRQDSNWRSFEETVQILVKAKALDETTLQATPLGQVARDINAENELWLAIVLTHASMQDLEPAELAAVMSAMLAGESGVRPNIAAEYGCSANVVKAIEAMEPDRETLFYLQVDANITAPLVVDLRLAGLVEGWASGLTWEQVMADCTLDSGDIARLLSRTVDILRQAGRTDSLLPTVRKNARRAVAAMSRSPITDLVQ